MLVLTTTIACLDSPCREVSNLARKVAKDVRTIAKNMKLLEQESSGLYNINFSLDGVTQIR